MSITVVNDYSTDTEGLPKTNFKDMKWLGHSYVRSSPDNDWIKSQVLIRNGVKAGVFLFEECASLESVLKSAEFNALSTDTSVRSGIRRMIAVLTYVYQARLQIRAKLRDISKLSDLNDEAQDSALEVDNEAAYVLIDELVRIAQQKDAEYGASWCKRGGIGAWFTTVRKFDRISTQLKNMSYDLWHTEFDGDQTESLEETLKDGINYLLLIEEKVMVIGNGFGR